MSITDGKHYDHAFCIAWMEPNQIAEECEKVRKRTALERGGIELELSETINFEEQGRPWLRIVWKVVGPASSLAVQNESTCNNALRFAGKSYPRTCRKCGLGPCPSATAYEKPSIALEVPESAISASHEPDDPLTAKRKREAFINAAFTREQQQAIGMILERWWSQKMAGIETGKVIEATETMPKQIAELQQAVAELQGR